MIFFRLRMEKFRQNCQNCILLHQRNIVGEFFLKKNLHFSNFLRASGENFSKRLSKLNSNIPEEHCWRNFLFKKTNKFRIFFRASGELFLAGLWNFILRYQSHLWRENVCLQKIIVSKTFFELRVKSLRQGCQNCSLHFLRNNLGENFVWKKI